jgi:hypothetical protein
MASQGLGRAEAAEKRAAFAGETVEEAFGGLSALFHHILLHFILSFGTQLMRQDESFCSVGV